MFGRKAGTANEIGGGGEIVYHTFSLPVLQKSRKRSKPIREHKTGSESQRHRRAERKDFF